jgi:hypothetical protein
LFTIARTHSGPTETRDLPLTALRRDEIGEPSPTGGLADFARIVFAGGDLQPAWDALMARAAAHPDDAGALLDLSTILQLAGQRAQGLALQADALARQHWYRRTLGTGRGPRLLALVAGGDMMASTPVEFLLAGWNGELDLIFLTPDAPVPARIPDHDVAILAVGESDANAPVLRAIAPLAARWPRPMLNAAAGAVSALGRDRAPALLAAAPGLAAPPTLRLARRELAAQPFGWPIIVRPIDSHAGAGLEKLDDAAALAAYLAAHADATFYAAPFIDYAGPDGRFRKLRVALVDGRPFLVHMAVSERWMVHYLNAGMAEDAGKRAEEAAMFASFDEGFARRHAGAFAALAGAFGLDYFAIDCAEDREGRLLLFEADTAMIVHDMDPPDLYPYKAPAMRQLFEAFQAMVAARAG